MATLPTNADISAADTAFMFMSTVLVFIMTPANGYFYAGTVEFKNAMSVIFVCMLTGTVITVQWFLWGYSIAWAETKNGFIGDLRHGGWNGIYDRPHINCPTIPGHLFMMFQLMFAQVTPALAFGSIAERTRILPWMIFLVLWSTFVYDIISYWTWNKGGWLYKWGIKDYAGGLPVHIVSGFSGLAAAIMVGKRSSAASMPHNLTHTALGTALFWFGWFGFNGGSECAINNRAVNAAVVTHLSACFGGITWILYDYRLHRKITSLGFCSGLICGLVCITPASGYVSAYYAPIFGIFGTLAGNNACFLKSRFEYDDSLDAFAVHGVVGFVGSILTGLFAESKIETLVTGDPSVKGGWVDGNFYLILPQLFGSLVGAVYVFCVTAGIIFVMSRTRIFGYSLSLRMSQEDEVTGTDFSLMGEVAYDFTHTGQKHIEAIMS
eukprot:Partr_v1_DN28162_c0_g1_i2_m56076 putative Ammonium transporter